MNLTAIISASLVIMLNHQCVAQTDSTKVVPELNLKVIEYCDSQMGKKVGRGECWDLAKYALDYSKAKWSPPFEFGRKLKPKEEVIAGDIIQFDNVRVEYKDNTYTTFPQHTAIIYEVLGPNHFIIAQQNVGKTRYVLKSEVDLNFKTKGKFDIYRPLKKL